MPSNDQSLDSEGLVDFLSIPEYPDVLTYQKVPALVRIGVFKKNKGETGRYLLQKSIRGYIKHLLGQIYTPQVSGKVLADYLGLGIRTIAQLRVDGVLTNYQDGKYDRNKSIREYCNHIRRVGQLGGKSLAEERTRLTKAQADNEELKLKEKKGELVHLETALEIWGPIFAAFSSKIDSINPKMRPIIKNISTDQQKKDAISHLSGLLYEARSEMSRLNAADYKDHQQDDQPPDAPAKKNHKSMGRRKKISK